MLAQYTICFLPQSLSVVGTLIFSGSFLGFNIVAPLVIAYKLQNVDRILAHATAASHDARRHIASAFTLVCKIAAFYAVVAAAFLPSFVSKDVVYMQVAGDLVQFTIVRHLPLTTCGHEADNKPTQILLPAFMILDVAMRQYRHSIVARTLGESWSKGRDESSRRWTGTDPECM
jgi:hypothetical protein